MQTSHDTPRSRSLLTSTILLSTIVLSACYDQRCNFVTAPSESAGSHSGNSSADGVRPITIAVKVDYFPGEGSPRDVLVSSPQGGSIVAVANEINVLPVSNMKKNDSVTFILRTDDNKTGSVTCKWTGRVGLLYDGKIVVSHGRSFTELAVGCGPF
jgi:hypothetical protein